jgi:hypothetical protein
MKKLIVITAVAVLGACSAQMSKAEWDSTEDPSMVASMDGLECSIRAESLLELELCR